jgi:hypothetical protein
MDKQEKNDETKQPYPPREFWRALLAIRDFAFARGTNEYFTEKGLPSQSSFRKSMDIVDNYLDLAINDGWLEDGRK